MSNTTDQTDVQELSSPSLAEVNADDVSNDLDATREEEVDVETTPSSNEDENGFQTEEQDGRDNKEIDNVTDVEEPVEENSFHDEQTNKDDIAMEGTSEPSENEEIIAEEPNEEEPEKEEAVIHSDNQKESVTENKMPQNRPRFLQSFSRNIQNVIDNNPNIVRAGKVFQSRAEAVIRDAVEKVTTNDEDSSSSSSESSASESYDESSKGSEDSSSSGENSVLSSEDEEEESRENRTHNLMAETADATASSIKTSAVASASAAALSAVASSYRGRYTNDAPNQFSTPSKLKSPESTSTNMQTPPPASARSNVSSGGGIFSALSRRSNRVIQNVKATPSPSRVPPGTQSQTALILASSAGQHMQKILSSLREGEYVMFLGPGFMGVNLKQAFKKRQGVYIDYIVPGGAADRSGVVSVGDSLLKVGNTDVTSGTIRNVPQIIAQAERPVVIVLKRDFKVTGGAMDVAIGKVLQVQEDVRSGKQQCLGNLHISEEKEDSDVDSVSNVEENSGSSTGNEDPNDKTTEVQNTPVQNLSFLPSPSKTVRESLIANAHKRSNEMSSFAAISRASNNDPEFQAIVRNAFFASCIDSRCLPFVASYFAGEDKYDYFIDSNGTINVDQPKNTSSPKSTSSPPTSSVRLMLYLEILSFEELFSITPPRRRRDHAKRVAQKFLMEYVDDNNNSEDTSASPPMFDLRSAISADVLDDIVSAINDKTQKIKRDVFEKCKRQIQNSLCGARFATFLISDDCAHMRAYLRGTAHYRHVPIEKMWSGIKSRDRNTNNYFLYALLYLLCWSDEENNNGTSVTKGKIAGGICAAIFIQRTLVPAIENGIEDKDALIDAYGRFWEIFLAPFGGVLDSISVSNECQDALDNARAALNHAIEQPYVVKALTTDNILSAMMRLSEELVFDYAVNIHPKFKESEAHELVCEELKDHEKDISHDQFLEFPEGCISRLMRKSHFPDRVSSHKPRRIEVNGKLSSMENVDQGKTSEKPTSRSLAEQLDMEAAKEDETSNIESEENDETPESFHPNMFNADYAVVFGSDDNKTDNDPSSPGLLTMQNSGVKRFVSIPLGGLGDVTIPSTLETYATVPPFREKSFRFRPSSSRLSDDGWEASLINFVVPNSTADQPNRCIYGVSLVLHQREKQNSSEENKSTSEYTKHFGSAMSSAQTGVLKYSPTRAAIEFAEEGMVVFDSDSSPLFRRSPKKEPPKEVVASFDRKVKNMLESSGTPSFARRMDETKWSQMSRTGGSTIGIALISSRNVIPAMRHTLSKFYESYSKCEDDVPESSIRLVAPLVDILASTESNKNDLHRLLDQYVQASIDPWIDRPLLAQKEEFEADAGEELLQCLPPIPLALLFVSALLEQKIIFSSTRRSVLLSACTALTKLLQPLEWSHLMVPLVPAKLAHDLIQYPAPYIIGIPSDNTETIGLLNSLPPEVTLIDLDIGRVILASSFASESSKVNATGALRSQMLRLAETLGDVLGEKLCEESWRCDDPSSSSNARFSNTSSLRYSRVCDLCEEFIKELLSGSSSCCYWLEESPKSNSSKSDPSVLFDEDRFLHLKNLREQGHYSPLFAKSSIKARGSVSGSDNLGVANHLSLSLDDFDLILESFLRTQGMSTYISSRKKSSMVFW